MCATNCEPAGLPESAGLLNWLQLGFVGGPQLMICQKLYNQTSDVLLGRIEGSVPGSAWYHEHLLIVHDH